MTLQKDQIIILIERKGNRQRQTQIIDVQERFVVVKDSEQAWFKETLLLVDIKNNIHPVYGIKIA